ncbi:MAG: hypothetical protein ACKESB_03775 [Candidatus Hodgkinia cicadicola]
MFIAVAELAHRTGWCSDRLKQVSCLRRLVLPSRVIDFYYFRPTFKSKLQIQKRGVNDAQKLFRYAQRQALRDELAMMN